MSADLVLLGERIAEHAAHLDAAMHRLLSDLREFDEGGGWHAQGARSCAHWLSWRVGWDLGTARDHVRVANKLAGLPAVDAALQRGEVSYSKVRAICRVATPENEPALLELARISTAQQLETVCRKYASVQRHGSEPRPADDAQRRYLRRRDTADGMVQIEAVLHPEEAAVVWAALERLAKEQCRESAPTASALDSAETRIGVAAPGSRSEAPDGMHHRHIVDPSTEPDASPGKPDRVSAETPGAGPRGGQPERHRAFDRASALVAMAQVVMRGDKPDRSPVELVLTVEAATLDQANESVDPSSVACFHDGTCISAETARRLGCDAGIVEIIEDRHGNTLSVGRKTRTIPGSLKRALLKRDRTCRFPGCTNRVFLEGHHLRHWADGGETKIDNLLCLCTHHHRYVHEYGYSVELASEEPRFRDRLGRLVLDAPPPPPMARVGWEPIRESNARLAITAHTNACGWDGERIDYGETIDALVRADGLD